MAAVHACIGALAGSLCKSKGRAFVAGVASHVVADILPHTDYDLKIEVPILAGAMLAIGKWKGTDSPEFWGAIGAVAPDSEHALLIAGLIKSEQEVFPTHIHEGKYHGLETGERWSQGLIAAASLAAVALSKKHLNE
ncbi:MAG: hypothetical protein M1133_03495 [Armatimonadetes bacterium]|nr:hypothetical protein [Armatimonadota bacterium]